MTKRLSQGFTAVELLIAMIVGVLLFGSAYQLYVAVVRDSTLTQQRAIANTYAYSLLRQKQKSSTDGPTTPCSVKPAKSAAVPSDVGLASGATAQVEIDCPFGTDSVLSRITVTVKYSTPAPAQVSREILVRA